MPKIIRVVRDIDQPRLEVGLPTSSRRENRKWLKACVPGKTIQPTWDGEAQCWRVAKLNFIPLVEAMANRFGTVDVRVQYSTTQQCDKRCRQAGGHDCQCSCMGREHGGGAWPAHWREIGDVLIGSTGRAWVRYSVRRQS